MEDLVITLSNGHIPVLPHPTHLYPTSSVAHHNVYQLNPSLPNWNDMTIPEDAHNLLKYRTSYTILPPIQLHRDMNGGHHSKHNNLHPHPHGLAQVGQDPLFIPNSPRAMAVSIHGPTVLLRGVINHQAPVSQFIAS